MKLPAHFMISETNGALYDTRAPGWHTRAPLRPNYQRGARVIENTHQLRAVLRQRYAWPGGYALLFTTHDGATLCMDCVRANHRAVSDSVRTKLDDGWRVVGVYADCETDGPVYCDHCGALLIEG